MRIVADTNTVLSGLLWQGPPRRLLELARERKVSLCTSLTLVAELAEVITPEPLPAPVSRDPDDDHVLACALAATAELIVSGDKRHLLILTEYQGIPIRTASDALVQLSAPPPSPK